MGIENSGEIWEANLLGPRDNGRHRGFMDIDAAVLKTLLGLPEKLPTKFLQDIHNKASELLKLENRKDLRFLPSNMELDRHHGTDLAILFIDEKTKKQYFISIDFTLNDILNKNFIADMIVRDTDVNFNSCFAKHDKENARKYRVTESIPVESEMEMKDALARAIVRLLKFKELFGDPNHAHEKLLIALKQASFRKKIADALRMPAETMLSQDEINTQTQKTTKPKGKGGRRKFVFNQAS
jgi:hypothetical protein